MRGSGGGLSSNGCQSYMLGLWIPYMPADAGTSLILFPQEFLSPWVLWLTNRKQREVMAVIRQKDSTPPRQCFAQHCFPEIAAL